MSELGTKVALVWLAALSALSSAGCEEGICDARDLEAALSSAVPGETVEIGACEIRGQFVVPAGVALKGGGPAASVLVHDGDGRVLTLAASDGEMTRVEDLSVRSAACAGIVALGPNGGAPDGMAGAVHLERVAVDVSRGVGIAAEGLATLTLHAVDARGPYTDGVMPGRTPSPPYTCERADVPTHGLVAARVGRVLAEEVDVRGFAAFGALFVDSDLEMASSSVDDNLGVGLEVWNGDAILENVSLCRARQGTLAIEAYNGLFAADATVESRGLEVCEGEAFGLMHDGATGMHEDLLARDNNFAGVWAQGEGALRVSGSGTLLENNGFAGLSAVNAGAVEVTDARVVGTTERTALVGDTGGIRAGDGLHLRNTPNVEARDLDIRDNERVGLLLDLGGDAPASLAVEAVTVEGAGEALGAISQDALLPEGWDDGITRVGAVAANDAAFEGRLDVAEAIGPLCLPDPSELSDGLGALVGM